MILLTKINDAPIAVNSDLIESIEETPDTVITMNNNDKVVVRESIQQVIEKVVQYRRLINGVEETEGESRPLRRFPLGALNTRAD